MKSFGAAVLLSLISVLIMADSSGNVTVRSENVKNNVYVLYGQGGNIGACVGQDGVFLIDDQFAPLSDQIRQELVRIQGGPVKFLVNTHWHFDHTGGNENFGQLGAVIVAHENVRLRLSTEQFMADFSKKIDPSPEKAWPIVTFTEDLTFHLNGEEIEVFHMENAHTDGDAVIFFKNSNVMHTGDIFFNGAYPFIDRSSGGSLVGLIDAVDYLLEITDQETLFIPGHGNVATRYEFEKYFDLLKIIQDRFSNAISMDKSLEEIKSAKILEDFDSEWGNGFMSPDKFYEVIYNLSVEQE